MKKMIAMITSMGMIFALTGCGSEPAESQPTPTAQVSEAATTEATVTETAATGTKTFSTVKGDVEIPTNPQKIVSDFYLGEFLALGVKPIIASSYSLDNPFFEGLTEGIAPLDTASSETSMEQIVAAEPDLIVTMNEEDYDVFSQIAPTVLIPYGTYNVKELFLYIGDMLGKKAEAESYIDTFMTEALSHKEEIQSIVGDQTVSIIEAWPNEVYVMGDKFARGGIILYDIWELKAPEPIQTKLIDGEEDFEIISLELLPEYAGDFIMYGVLEGTDSAYIEGSDIWGTLPAVQAGQVMPYEQVAFMQADPISLSKQMDIFVEFFAQYK